MATGGIFTIVASAASLAFIVGVVIGHSRLSALRSFIAIYFGALLVFFAVLFVQGPFVLALLGTLVVAIASMVPAGGGFVGGTWLAKRLQAGNRKQNAP